MFNSLNFLVTIPSFNSAYYVPEKKHIVNNFDLIGQLVGVKRNKDESNIELKKRTWDVSVNPTGPTYDGVVNSITRDLGLKKEVAFTITPKQVSGEYVGASPMIEITPDRVILYSSWGIGNGSLKTIDKEIYFYKKDSEGYYLSDLVAAINTSTCFEAVMQSGIRSNTFSRCIVKNKTAFYVYNQVISISKMNKLYYDNIVLGSLSFADTVTFRKEVIGDPAEVGEYKIDYKQGIVYTFAHPREETICNYYANNFPLEVEISPVQVYSLFDDSYYDLLFEKEEINSGEIINTVLNSDGVDIMNKVFSDNKMFWGR
jgi:hypothetical protein